MPLNKETKPNQTEKYRNFPSESIQNYYWKSQDVSSSICYINCRAFTSLGFAKKHLKEKFIHLGSIFKSEVINFLNHFAGNYNICRVHYNNVW